MVIGVGIQEWTVLDWLLLARNQTNALDIVILVVLTLLVSIADCFLDFHLNNRLQVAQCEL